jgi:hypothetical protein
MQRQVLKILPGILLFLCAHGYVAHAQLLTYHLAKADSLFQQKRYTQSLELYQSIFDKNQFTPAMLLKMAYVEEGLENVARTLYYLSVYYVNTKDERVVSKINELASKHRLSGYEQTDTEQLLTVYQEYHTSITGILGALTFLLLAMVVYNKRHGRPAISVFASLVFVLLLLGLHINLPTTYQAGITMNPATYVMSGPSAGASVVRILGEGHRVHIRGEKDVWWNVSYNNTDAYIKRDNLLLINH